MSDRVVIEPESLRASATQFRRVAEAFDLMGPTVLVGAATVRLNPVDPGLRAARFRQEVSAVDSALSAVADEFVEDASTLTATASDAEFADGGLWQVAADWAAVYDLGRLKAGSGEIPEPVLALAAITTSQAIDQWTGSDLDPRFLELVARRRALHEDLGWAPGSLSATDADRLVADLSEGWAGPDVSAPALGVVFATALHDSGAIGAPGPLSSKPAGDAAGDEWLGQYLAGFMSGNEALADTTVGRPQGVDMASRVIATDLEVATSFFTTLGTHGTAMLAHRTEAGVREAAPTTEPWEVSEATRRFGAGLAAVSRQGDLPFGGDELVTSPVLSTTAGPDHPPSLLFTTSAPFDTGFLVSATTAELLQREHRPAMVGGDEAVNSMLVAVAQAGPEAAVDLVSGLGAHRQILFRPADPITELGPGGQGSAHGLDQLFDALRDHPEVGGTVTDLVVGEAGATTAPMPDYVATIVRTDLSANLMDLSARLEHTGGQHPGPAGSGLAGRPTLQTTVDAVTAVYRSGDLGFAGAERGVMDGMIVAALREDRAAAAGRPITGSDHWNVAGYGLGILQTGRENAGLIEAIDEDRAQQQMKDTYSLGTEAALGLVPVVGSTLGGIVVDVAVGEGGDRIFDTSRELGRLGLIIREGDLDTFGFPVVVADYLHDTDQLIIDPAPGRTIGDVQAEAATMLDHLNALADGSPEARDGVDALTISDELIRLRALTQDGEMMLLPPGGDQPVTVFEWATTSEANQAFPVAAEVHLRTSVATNS